MCATGSLIQHAANDCRDGGNRAVADVGLTEQGCPPGPWRQAALRHSGFRDGHAGTPPARSGDFRRLPKIRGTKALLHR